MRRAVLAAALTLAGCFGSSGEFQACAEACAKQGRAMATFRALRREERSFDMLTNDTPCGHETRRAGVDWLVDNERGVLVKLYRSPT